MKKLIITGEAILLLIILYLKDYNPSTASEIAQHQALSPFLAYIIFLIFLHFGTHLIKYFYSKTTQNDYQKDNVHFGIDNIGKVLVGFGLVITLFGMFGIDFKSLLTSMSIVAAAIAILSKDFINDFLVGLYFSFSKDFEINDYVKLEEHKGKIIEIAMLKIKLLNDDDDIVIIPNGKVYLNEIVNYTKRDIRLMTIDFQLDITRIENIEQLEDDLILTLVDFSEFIEANSYNLKIVDVKKDYLDFKFQYTLKTLDMDLQRKIRKKTVRRIFNYISSKN